MMKKKQYNILNDIYKRLLNRPVDQDGIVSYIRYVDTQAGIDRIIDTIMNSSEYRYKQKILIKPIIGSSYNYDNLDLLKDKNILILSLISNCEHNIHKTLHLLNSLKYLYNNVCYYFFTNNNIDNTVTKLQNITNQHIDGTVYDNENIYIRHGRNRLGNRINKLAEYRNIIFDHAIHRFDIDFDYVIVMDGDFLTAPSALDIARATCTQLPEWSCISANYCYNNTNYYYDTLALRLLDDNDDINDLYPNFMKYYGINHEWIDRLYTFQDYVQVKYAFGGLAIYKFNELIDIYNKFSQMYDIYPEIPSLCEHITLAQKLSNNIYIDSNIYFETVEPFFIKI